MKKTQIFHVLALRLVLNCVKKDFFIKTSSQSYKITEGELVAKDFIKTIKCGIKFVVTRRHLVARNDKKVTLTFKLHIHFHEPFDI